MNPAHDFHNSINAIVINDFLHIGYRAGIYIHFPGKYKDAANLHVVSLVRDAANTAAHYSVTKQS